MAVRDSHRSNPSTRPGARLVKAHGWAVSLLAALLLALPLGTAAATPKPVATAGSARGLRGGTNVPVSVSLKSVNGARVMALSFDLTYNSSRLSVASATLGEAAASAWKSISWSQPAPTASGCSSLA